VKRIHYYLLAAIPLLASCQLNYIHEFEPSVAGRPVRSSQDRLRLQTAVANTSREHGLPPRPDGKPGSSERAIDSRLEEHVAVYRRPTGRCLTLYLLRDIGNRTHKVRIAESTILRSKESEQIEQEIRAILR
jgi:hypothetical protein